MHTDDATDGEFSAPPAFSARSAPRTYRQSPTHRHAPATHKKKTINRSSPEKRTPEGQTPGSCNFPPTTPGQQLGGGRRAGVKRHSKKKKKKQKKARESNVTGCFIKQLQKLPPRQAATGPLAACVSPPLLSSSRDCSRFDRSQSFSVARVEVGFGLRKAKRRRRVNKPTFPFTGAR